MTYKRTGLLAVLFALASTAIIAAEAEKPQMRVLGSVLADGMPAQEALVLALSLSENSDFRVRTDHDGRFALPTLPRGIYRIVAVKRGFIPAIETIVPNRLRHTVSLAMEVTRPLTRSEREAIWQIRRSIPGDVLRDLGFDPLGTGLEHGAGAPHFEARMMSLTGVAAGEDAGWSRSALGISGRAPNGWEVAVDGSLAHQDSVRGFDHQSEMAGLAMRVTPVRGQEVELATTTVRWDQTGDAAGSALETHRLGWSDDRTRVELSYVNQENVISRDFSTETIGIEGERNLYKGSTTNLDVAVRVEQLKGLDSSNAEAMAEFAALATHEIGKVLEVGYGFRSRHSDYGSQWVPETVARISIGSSSSIVFSGHYKMYEDEQEVLNVPAVVFLEESGQALPRYRYSIGFVAGDEEAPTGLSASASVAEIDTLLRVLFDHGFDAMWDGLYLEAGDVHRDVSLSFHHQLTDRIILSLRSSAGWAGPREDESQKRYWTGSLQSLYRPWGTSLDFAYRYVAQPLAADRAQENERIAVRMGQSLRLPLDLKLLLGVDLMRENAVALELDPPELRTRYVGGLALAF